MPTDKLPDEVTLPVPRVYHDYLVHKRIRSLARNLALGLLASFLLWCLFDFMLHRTISSATPHIVGLLMALVFGSKLSELRRKTWHYTLNEEEFRLVWWTGERSTDWNWYGLNWRKDAIVRVEHDEWRGLPLLRLVTDDATPNVVMVYAHEDRDTVQNIVLPLIEKYRKQYRHPLWTDLLWQEKQTL